VTIVHAGRVTTSGEESNPPWRLPDPVSASVFANASAADLKSLHRKRRNEPQGLQIEKRH
jgi:hypothetical protein